MTDPLDLSFPSPTPALTGSPLEDVKTEFGGPSGGEVVEAAFRQENIISSFYAASQRTVLENDDIDPDFDPVSRAVEDGIHGEEILKYADAINVEDYDGVKARIDAENEDRKTISEGGAFGVYSSIGGAVLSPINFIPVAGVTAKIGSAGLKFWQNAGIVGGVASATVGVEEGLLHATQTERTVEESAYAVSGAMFLGGLLGVAVSKVDPGEFAVVSKKIDDQSHADPHTQYTATRDESQIFAESGQSVGADALRLTDEMGETLLNEKQIRVINLSTGGKFMPGLSPVVQVKAVQLPLKIKAKMSKYVDLMANNFLLGGKVLDGVKMDQATELVFKQIDGAVMDAQRDANKAFVDYHNATTGGTFRKKASRAQFEKNVYQAMLTGTFEHVDDALMPHIRKATESYRKNVYNPIRDLAIENKLLPEDVGADEMFQYMNRNPNRQALVGNKRKYLVLQSDYIEQQTLQAIETAKVEHVANIAAKEKDVLELSTTSKKIDSVQGQVDKLKKEGVDKEVEKSVKKETQRLEKARSAKKRTESGRRKRIENRFAKKLEAATKKAEELKTPEGRAKRVEAATKSLDTQKASELTRLDDSIKKTDADLAKSIKEIDVDTLRASAKEKVGKGLSEREELLGKLKERRASQKDVARAEIELEDLRGLDVAREFVRATNPALAEGAFNVDVMVNRFSRASAEKTYSRYLGLAPGSPAGLEAMAESGPLAKRTNKIPDRYTVIDPVDGKEIIFSDFMNQDMSQLSHSYSRFMMPKIELKQKFGSLMEPLPGQKGVPDGTVKWSDIERDLQKSFDEELHSGTKDLTEEDISAYNRSKDTMKFMFEMLDGTYKTGLNDPDSIIQRGLKAMNQLNVMRLLGDIVKSSFIDPGKMVMSHGFGRAFDGQLRSMGTQLNNMFSGSTPAIKAELNSFGIALNTELATRILQMSELGDPYAAGSAFENFMNNSVKTFTKVTGFSYWNDTMQLASGITNQKRLYDLATGDLAFDSLSKSDRVYLLGSGIDADALGAIEDMLIKHGDTKSTKGLAVFNYDKWTDPVAKDISQKFIIKNSIFDVMEPGIGDIPQVMRSSAGKVMGQFKSFNMTATNSILASGLQRNDKAFYQGLLSMVGLGMMVYATKELSHGREITTDPRKLILEGFDRSGILGTWSDVNNITEKMTGYGLSSLTGEEGAGNSRYRSRSAVEAVLGPSMGTFANFAAVSNAMFSGEVKREDLHNIRKLTPYQNHPIFAHGADQIEKGAASLFGIKKTKKRRKKK